MAELASFFIRLNTILDDSGFKKAQAGVKQTEKSVVGLNGTLGALGSMVSAGAAVWGLVDFAKQSVKAAAEQESANNRLALAMKNLGVFTQQAFQEQLDFAASLQRTTTFADEAITEAQALLTTYGLYGQKLQSTVVAALDLATARHIDLNTAATMLGKAYQGQTEALGRYGIRIRETGNTAKDFQQVLDAINRSMSGSAAAATQTFDGKVRQLHLSFGELKESIGTNLIPVVSRYVQDLRVISDGINEYIQKRREANRTDKTNIEQLDEERRRVVGVRLEYDERAKAMEARGNAAAAAAIRESAAYGGVVERIRQLNEQIAIANKSNPPVKPPKPNFTPLPTSDEELARSERAAREELDMLEAAQRRIDSGRMTAEQLELIEANRFADQLMMRGQYDKANELRDAAKEKYDKAMAQRKMAAQAQVFSYIASLATSTNKTLAAVGKAGAIAEATINAHVAFTKAMASFPPPINFGLAAAVLAASMAQVAQISGVTFAQGGVAKAQPGGVFAKMAEVGFDEAAIPLGDPRTKARLADMFLPRGVTREDLAGAVGGGKRGARGAGVVQVTVQQYNTFEGGAAGAAGAPGTEGVLRQIREAARDGTEEGLAASKEIYETGRRLAGEA